MATTRKLLDAIHVFSQFFDQVEQAIAIVGVDGRFLYFNPKMYSIDITDEEAIGQHVLERWPYLSDETSTMMRSVNKGEKFFSNHQVYYTRTGQVMDYLHTTLPIYDEASQIIGAIEIGRNIDSLKHLSDQVLELSERLYAQGKEKQVPDAKEIITRSSGMLRIIGELDRYAVQDIPLLIYGETGTGKELFVQRAHRKSLRAGKPLITLNCAAIPGTLMEGILFGTKKGAFTGSENRKGIFDIADCGTIFLDELNSMPIDIQAKLLRVLQDGEIMKLGENVSTKVNVRVITAMNEPPEQAIKLRHLRQDLYYRISVGYINIPSLRERPEDIVPLAEHFLRKYVREINSRVSAIAPQARRELETFDWPGNVRMLENVIRRSVLLEDPDHTELCKIHYQLAEFQSSHNNQQDDNQERQASRSDADSSLADRVDDYERNLIQQALQRTGGNIKQTALLLHTPRPTLQRKIKLYHLQQFE
jgi:arginine utilization regulatory protein